MCMVMVMGMVMLSQVQIFHDMLTYTVVITKNMQWSNIEYEVSGINYQASKNK